MNNPIRPIDLTHTGDMLNLLSLQMAAYIREAELIGLSDIPPLLDSPDSIRSSGERFYGYYSDEAEGSKLAGAVSVQEAPSSGPGSKLWAIRRLMVQPDRFRQGIGTALVRHVLEESALQGVPVSVRCVSTNHAALSLYRSLSFVPVRQYPPLENGLILVELLCGTPTAASIE
jgi:ribosomal protein S18 acetylase RimI-like enzyme